jgi:hypothetical protein
MTQNATQMMAAIHVTAKELTRGVKGAGTNFIWTISSPLQVYI